MNSSESSLSQGSLWDKLFKVKLVVSSWQKSKYGKSSTCLKDCEEELGLLLNCRIPSTASELLVFIMKKHDLSLELNCLRIIEDRCWRQKYRVQWLI